MKRFCGVTALIALTALVSGCDIRAVESRKVYAAVLQLFEEGQHTRYIREQVVSPIERSSNPFALKAGDKRLAIYTSFDFPAHRKTHSALDFGDIDVHVITKAKKDWLFARSCEDGWKTFYRNYKGAKSMIAFSNVGYRANGQEAIVYFTYHRGCLDAGGALVMLEKKQGHWSVVKTIGLWIS